MFSAASFGNNLRCHTFKLTMMRIYREVSIQDSIGPFLFDSAAGNAAREFLQWLLFEATFYRKSLHRHLPLLQGDLEICNFWKPNYSNSRNKFCTIGSRSEAHT